MKDTITLNTVASYETAIHGIRAAKNIVRWNPCLALMIMIGISGRNLNNIETSVWNNACRSINDFLDSLANMSVKGTPDERKRGKLKEVDVWWGDKSYYKSPYPEFTDDKFTLPRRLEYLEAPLI